MDCHAAARNDDRWMDFLIRAISFLWFIRTIKFVLFWIYLWQLKEYHVGRFLDHFKTYKGKKLLFDPLVAVKILLLPLLFLRPGFAWILLLVYGAEFLFFGLTIVKRTFKKPVFTGKVILLTVVSLALAVAFLVEAYVVKNNVLFAASLLIFDIVTPIVVSFVVLIFQPFFVMARRRILKKAARKMAEHKNLIVIGITGSYGKTSTKEFLATILSSKFNVLATPDHKNSEMGIAQTILQDLRPEHQVFIVEMGSYNKGGIKLLCDMVKPRIGMVTGVNQQHLATFGSMENLLWAEGGRELVQCLPKNGLVIVNGDNPYCLDLYKKIYTLAGGLKKQLYTTKKEKLESDIWTEDISVKKESLSFIARDKDGYLASMSVSVLGKQNVQNLLAAILAAKSLGMSLQDIALAVKHIRPEQAGMTIKRGAHGIEIIDSSYSSNPDGVMADLDYLNIFPGRKVLVMPCLIELGSESSNIHKKIGKKIAQVCDMAIITTRDQFENIKKGATENGMDEKQILLCDPSISIRAGKPQEIVSHITTFCKEGDAVLLEGRVPSQLITLLYGQ